MKLMKKVLAFAMAAAMILGMTMMVSAAPSRGDDQIYGTEDDMGTIQVKGITPEADLTVKAYPIVKAIYDETTGVFSGYEALYNGIDLTKEPIEISQAQLNTIMESLDVAHGEYGLSQSGDFYTADVPVGAYLVKIEGAETKVYNAVVASTYYVVNATQTGNEIHTEVVDITDDPAWVKVSDVPKIGKTVSDDNETDAKGNSVNIGDDVTYTVTIDPVPNYGGDYPKLNVVDTLSSGLTYIEESLVVKTGETTLVKDTDYTLKVDGQTITVDFVVNGVYTLNEYAGESVVIT